MFWIMLTIILILCIVIIFLAYFCYKHAMIILRMEPIIENALDVIDERYQSISRILQIPLFYDSPEIKRMHDDIVATKNAILDIANELSKSLDKPSIEKDEEDEENS